MVQGFRAKGRARERLHLTGLYPVVHGTATDPQIPVSIHQAVSGFGFSGGPLLLCPLFAINGQQHPQHREQNDARKRPAATGELAALACEPMAKGSRRSPPRRRLPRPPLRGRPLTRNPPHGPASDPRRPHRGRGAGPHRVGRRQARSKGPLAATGGRRKARQAAAVTWADVEFRSDGSGRLTVTRSKTDQEGEGAVQYLGSVAAVQVAGRWASSRMPAYYARGELAARGAVAQFYGD